MVILKITVYWASPALQKNKLSPSSGSESKRKEQEEGKFVVRFCWFAALACALTMKMEVMFFRNVGPNYD
jgi:hypothetical protein